MEKKSVAQTSKALSNPVHQMKIYEEFVKKEKSYSHRNKTEEFTMNPSTRNYAFIFIYLFSCKPS